MALWKGAAKVYVVDNNKPVCDDERIEVISREEISQKALRADYSISYSSFERDGFGRYGDPLSPDGDLQAMKEARTFLKEGGLLFLSIPLGDDCIVWNAHRIYGRKRLPLLLKGWQLIDTFDINEKDNPGCPFDLPPEKYIQNILVLKKIDSECEYPDDDYLLGKNQIGGERNEVCEKINPSVIPRLCRGTPRV